MEQQTDLEWITVKLQWYSQQACGISVPYNRHHIPQLTNNSDHCLVLTVSEHYEHSIEETVW